MILSSIRGRSGQKSRYNRVKAGFSIVEALMSSMLLAAVMVGLLTLAGLTFTAEDRERKKREDLLNASSVAAEINSGVLSGDFGSFLGISGIVERTPKPYGPGSYNVSIWSEFQKNEKSWRVLCIRSGL
jgi:hypothetical protein